MACFEFATTRCSGVARFGEVGIGAGSIVNSMILRVDPSRVVNLDIEVKESIVAWMVPDNGPRYEVFRGIVSKLRPDGALMAIEAATPGAFLAVSPAQVYSWSDVSMKKILLDLLSMASAIYSVAELPAALSDTILHVWNTHGGSIAEEIDALLKSSKTGLEAYGGVDGRLYFGDRTSLSALFDLLPWPFDESFGETDTDVGRFQPRAAFPYQPVFDPTRNSFVGTVDSVSHVVDESGAYTDMTIDEGIDSGIQDRVERLGPTVVVNSALVGNGGMANTEAEDIDAALQAQMDEDDASLEEEAGP